MKEKWEVFQAGHTMLFYIICKLFNDRQCKITLAGIWCLYVKKEGKWWKWHLGDILCECKTFWFYSMGNKELTIAFWAESNMIRCWALENNLGSSVWGGKRQQQGQFWRQLWKPQWETMKTSVKSWGGGGKEGYRRGSTGKN